MSKPGRPATPPTRFDSSSSSSHVLPRRPDSTDSMTIDDEQNPSAESLLSLSFHYPWDSPMRKGNSSPPPPPNPATASAGAGVGAGHGSFMVKSRLRMVDESMSPTDLLSPLGSPLQQTTPLSPSSARGGTEGDEFTVNEVPIEPAANRIGSNQSTSDQEALSGSPAGNGTGPHTHQKTVHQTSDQHAEEAFLRRPLPPLTGAGGHGGGSHGANGREGSGGGVGLPTTPAKRSTLSMLFTSLSGSTLASDDSFSSPVSQKSSSSSLSPFVAAPVSSSSKHRSLADPAPDFSSLQHQQQERRGRRNRSSSNGSLNKSGKLSSSLPSSPVDLSGPGGSVIIKTSRSRRNSGSKKRASSSDRAMADYNLSEPTYSGFLFLFFFFFSLLLFSFFPSS